MASVTLTLGQGCTPQDEQFPKFLASVVSEATGRPEPLVMAMVLHSDLMPSLLQQPAATLHLVLIGTEDPHRAQQIVKFLTWKLADKLGVMRSHISVIVRFVERNHTIIAGELR